MAQYGSIEIINKKIGQMKKKCRPKNMLLNIMLDLVAKNWSTNSADKFVKSFVYTNTNSTNMFDCKNYLLYSQQIWRTIRDPLEWLVWPVAVDIGSILGDPLECTVWPQG
jgi:hypothetical protein